MEGHEVIWAINGAAAAKDQVCVVVMVVVVVVVWANAGLRRFVCRRQMKDNTSKETEVQVTSLANNS